MSEIVEKVARAILAAHDWTIDNQPGEKTGWEAMQPDWQDAYRAMARGAIEAMREPTEAMVTAAAKSLYGAEDDVYAPRFTELREKDRDRFRDDARYALKAGIDTALKP